MFCAMCGETVFGNILEHKHRKGKNMSQRTPGACPNTTHCGNCKWLQDNTRLITEAPAVYKLIGRMATWKEREDGLVYGDEPLTEYLLEARAILARIDRER